MKIECLNARFLQLILLAVLSFGCAHNPDKRMIAFGGEDSVFHSDKAGQSVEARLLWAKNKPRAVDMSLQITNKSDRKVVLKIRNFKGEVGGVEASSVIPDEYIQLEPGFSFTGTVALRFTAPNEERIGTVKVTMPISEGTATDEGKALKPLVVQFNLKDPSR